jgi:site-specific recombinase XerD
LRINQAIVNFFIVKKQTRGKKTVKIYGYFLNQGEDRFESRAIGEIAPNDILAFLFRNTDGQKQATKCFKYTTLKTFFNFIKNNENEPAVNPCDTQLLRKTFRIAKGFQGTILGKDTVDEIIFKTNNPRDRLMLELMVRGGMRIGELLKLMVQICSHKPFYFAP